MGSFAGSTEFWLLVTTGGTKGKPGIPGGRDMGNRTPGNPANPGILGKSLAAIEGAVGITGE